MTLPLAPQPELIFRTETVPEAVAVPQERIHDLNGPSSLERRIPCPGSARLEALEPPSTSSYAERGTGLHGIVATLISGDGVDVSALESLEPRDREQVDAVLNAVIDDRPKGVDRDLVQLVEHRVDLAAYGIPAGGTLDHAWVVPGVRAVLHDWKFGARPVTHPQHNWQQIAYAIGLADDFGVQEVESVILRPGTDPEWQRMQWTFSADEIDRMRYHLKAAIRATQDPAAPLHPGDHCTFCRGKERCPARWAAVAAIPRHSAYNELIATWSPIQRRDMWDRLSIAQSQLRSLAERMKQLAIDGSAPIHGMVPKPGRGTRIWGGMTIEIEACMKKACALKGIPEDRIMGSELLSPAAFEKLVGKSAAVVEILKPFITTKPGEPTLGEG